MSNVDQGYLVSALEAGQPYEIGALSYVAGSYVQPVNDEQQCYVECADTGSLAEPMLSKLTGALGDGFPQARRLLLRPPGNVDLPRPWAKHLTYIRYGGQAGTPDPAILPARPGDHGLIIDWLMRA